MSPKKPSPATRALRDSADTARERRLTKRLMMSEWATMWLAATVLRLLLTPVAAYVLYSAAPLSLTPLMLSVGGTYLVVLLVEAAFLALHVKRVA